MQKLPAARSRETYHEVSYYQKVRKFLNQSAGAPKNFVHKSAEPGGHARPGLGRRRHWQTYPESFCISPLSGGDAPGPGSADGGSGRLIQKVFA